MLLEIFIFFEIITIGLFFTAFFTKQEIMWALTLVMSGIMMFASWSVETFVYQYNDSISAYSPITVSYHYPYLVALNMLFLVLAMLLGIFDLFDKYGSSVSEVLGRFKVK